MAQLKLAPFAAEKDLIGTRSKAKIDVVEHEVFHEIGQELIGTSTHTEILKVKPSPTTTVIRLKSTVVASAAARLSSPQYIAVTRRRKVANLVSDINALANHADRDDFVVFTRRVVARIREILDYLQPAKLEGNAREVLRYVRDTFVNGGWDLYKNNARRTGVVEILQQLVDEDEVQREAPEEAFDKLFDLGFDPVASPGFYYDPADTESRAVDAKD